MGLPVNMRATGHRLRIIYMTEVLNDSRSSHRRLPSPLLKTSASIHLLRLILSARLARLRICLLSPCPYPRKFTLSSVPASQRKLVMFRVMSRRPLMSRLGAAVFGYDLGVIAYVIEAPDFLRVTSLEGGSADAANWTGFIVSVMLLGYVFPSSEPTWTQSDAPVHLFLLCLPDSPPIATPDGQLVSSIQKFN